MKNTNQYTKTSYTKPVVITLLILLGIAYFAFAVDHTVIYKNSDTNQDVATNPLLVEVPVEVNILDKKVLEAQDAKRQEVEDKAKQAYQSYVDNAMLEIKTSVTDQYIQELQTQNKLDKKNTAAY